MFGFRIQSRSQFQTINYQLSNLLNFSSQYTATSLYETKDVDYED